MRKRHAKAWIVVHQSDVQYSVNDGIFTAIIIISKPVVATAWVVHSVASVSLSVSVCLSVCLSMLWKRNTVRYQPLSVVGMHWPLGQKAKGHRVIRLLQARHASAFRCDCTYSSYYYGPANLNGWWMDGIIDFYRAIHYSAKRGLEIACRLSICLSICL